MQIHTIHNQHVVDTVVMGGGIVIIDAIYCELTSSGVVSANGQQGGEAYDPVKRRSRNGGGGAWRFYFIHWKCRK